MKSSALVAGMILLSGCVTVSEKQKEEREYRDAEQRAAYVAYRQRCRDNGGIVIVNGSNSRLTSSVIPNRGDYFCQRSISYR